MIVHKFYGPPGTGKTTRLMKLVEERVAAGVPLHRIGYFSFSRSAAEVIKERMHAKVDDVRWFRTLHGACVKALGMGGAIMNWRDYERFSELTKMKVSPEDSWYDEEQGMDFNPALRALNMSLTTLKPLHIVVREGVYHPNLAQERLDAFVKAWHNFKQGQHKYDFIDMLTEYDAHGQPLPIDEAFLDEGQDLTNLQWRVFHKMTANCSRVYMAGDDDQAIYGFIGGSEYGFLEHPADEEEVIRQSWRVPAVVGAEADRIIKKVRHRKDKQVIWRDAPGKINRWNLEIGEIQWHNLENRFKSIMILNRHRKGAARASDELKSIGVQHIFDGETMQTWKETKVVHSYFKLRDGGTITARQAKALALATGMPHEKFDALTTGDRVSADALALDYRSPLWIRNFVIDRRHRSKYEALRRLINRDGIEALAKDPKISVGTMHASKGKEAELVVIMPDCTDIVKHNMNEPSEIRLAYVSLTRTLKEAVLLLPRTDNHITHYLGV